MKAKQGKLSKGKSSGKMAPAAGSFRDRDLAKIDPLKEQFEPQEGNPVPQHYKMAGGD